MLLASLMGTADLHHLLQLYLIVSYLLRVSAAVHH